QMIPKAFQAHHLRSAAGAGEAARLAALGTARVETAAALRFIAALGASGGGRGGDAPPRRPPRRPVGPDRLLRGVPCHRPVELPAAVSGGRGIRAHLRGARPSVTLTK